MFLTREKQTTAENYKTKDSTLRTKTSRLCCHAFPGKLNLPFFSYPVCCANLSAKPSGNPYHPLLAPIPSDPRLFTSTTNPASFRWYGVNGGGATSANRQEQGPEEATADDPLRDWHRRRLHVVEGVLDAPSRTVHVRVYCTTREDGDCC